MARAYKRDLRWANDIGQETSVEVSGEASWRRTWELSLKKRSGEEEKKRGQGTEKAILGGGSRIR